MNKADERKLFDLLYQPKIQWSVVEDESPDFRCSVAGQNVLGVEVTELFANESDARLKKIPNYVAELTHQRKFRHADDKKRLKVEKFIYDPNGPNRQEIIGVIQEERTLRDSFGLLGGVLEKKTAKAKNYLKNAPAVDLVVKDASHLLHFDEYVPFYFALSASLDRIAVINSPFREIFLVTSMKGGTTVKIPLKLNLLLEDFEIFTKVLTASKRYEDNKWKHQYFLWLAKCLYNFGYKQARIAAKKPGASIVLGCWEVGLWDGSKRVADYICSPHEMPHSELITNEIDDVIDGEDKNISEFLEGRKKLACCLPFYFPLDSDATKSIDA